MIGDINDTWLVRLQSPYLRDKGKIIYEGRGAQDIRKGGTWEARA